eukprot:Hpha_TRINITY_DN15562_c1_g15::TRINITY_DN15562_c1_g15_i1::g.103857::m.103857
MFSLNWACLLVSRCTSRPVPAVGAPLGAAAELRLHHHWLLLLVDLTPVAPVRPPARGLLDGGGPGRRGSPQGRGGPWGRGSVVRLHAGLVDIHARLLDLHAHLAELLPQSVSRDPSLGVEVGLQPLLVNPARDVVPHFNQPPLGRALTRLVFPGGLDLTHLLVRVPDLRLRESRDLPDLRPAAVVKAERPASLLAGLEEGGVLLLPHHQLGVAPEKVLLDGGEGETHGVVLIGLSLDVVSELLGALHTKVHLVAERHTPGSGLALVLLGPVQPAHAPQPLFQGPLRVPSEVLPLLLRLEVQEVTKQELPLASTRPLQAPPARLELDQLAVAREAPGALVGARGVGVERSLPLRVGLVGDDCLEGVDHFHVLRHEVEPPVRRGAGLREVDEEVPRPVGLLRNHMGPGAGGRALGDGL